MWLLLFLRYIEYRSLTTELSSCAVAIALVVDGTLTIHFSTPSRAGTEIANHRISCGNFSIESFTTKLGSFGSAECHLQYVGHDSCSCRDNSRRGDCQLNVLSTSIRVRHGLCRIDHSPIVSRIFAMMYYEVIVIAEQVLSNELGCVQEQTESF